MTETLRTERETAAEIDTLPLSQFVWGAGVECSILPHIDVDQFKWTQHDRFWREDFRRARDEAGVSTLRYAFPWHVLEPEPGRFDWSYADERMAELERLGMQPILDVMHFGTPLWLKQAVGDPLFPESLERFTEALVTRYRRQVKIWSPFNEPLVAALFSGDFGFWPPHARKWRGYMPVLSRIVQGVNRSIRAIRRAAPEAAVLLCDAAENYKSRAPALADEVARRNLRRFVAMDLLTGRVDPYHPLYSWLSDYGVSELDLDWFRTNPQRPDVFGLDYYSHSDWQLDQVGDGIRQRRAENPAGLYSVSVAYYNRYGIPLLLSETSIEGQPINREIWFDSTVSDIERLRSEGIPMLGYIWWPLIDQVDWDGALTHRIGKVHQVGLFTLGRQPDGTLARVATSMVNLFREAAAQGEERVGKLEFVAEPAGVDDPQLPPLATTTPTIVTKGNNGNGNGKTAPAPSPGARVSAPALVAADDSRAPGAHGIVVFSHLRWGFVWQRPQQFLSRFARKHTVLFIEEPMFDMRDGEEPDIALHRVMPNVVVSTPHMPQSWNRNPKLPEKLREFAHRAIRDMNENGEFDLPLLWYYNPMDSAWSLGYFVNRGIVYDSMDELSQFTGAPKSLITNEQRLMDHADIVFAGGYELSLRKKQRHGNVHFFGCGVEFEHFAKAQDPTTMIPPDIDFMARPILGWFGVVDERVDYQLLVELAKLRPNWSVAMVGPVVKMDPSLLPHAPNLFFLGQRDYQVLPNYCRAFDVCIMPFAINSATEYINPTKVLEYLATGRPIISTPVKDVVRQYPDLVSIVKTPEEFAATAETLLNHPDPDRIARGIERARANSWDSTVKQMQELIGKAIAKPDRPSSRKVPPLPESELLAYTYQATPGS